MINQIIIIVSIVAMIAAGILINGLFKTMNTLEKEVAQLNVIKEKNKFLEAQLEMSERIYVDKITEISEKLSPSYSDYGLKVLVGCAIVATAAYFIKHINASNNVLIENNQQNATCIIEEVSGNVIKAINDKEGVIQTGTNNLDRHMDLLGDQMSRNFTYIIDTMKSKDIHNQLNNPVADNVTMARPDMTMPADDIIPAITNLGDSASGTNGPLQLVDPAIPLESHRVDYSSFNGIEYVSDYHLIYFQDIFINNLLSITFLVIITLFFLIFEKDI